MLCVLCVCVCVRRTPPPPDPLPPPPNPPSAPHLLRRTPPPSDRPKFCSFFPPSSIFVFFSLSGGREGLLVSFFLSSLGVFSLDFGGVFEGRDPQMCTFGLSKRAHLRVPALQKPPNFHEKTPRERKNAKKKRKWGGRGKNSAKFCAPTLRAPHLAGPNFSGSSPHLLGRPLFLGLGPNPSVDSTHHTSFFSCTARVLNNVLHNTLA